MADVLITVLQSFPALFFDMFPDLAQREAFQIIVVVLRLGIHAFRIIGIDVTSGSNGIFLLVFCAVIPPEN